MAFTWSIIGRGPHRRDRWSSRGGIRPLSVSLDCRWRANEVILRITVLSLQRMAVKREARSGTAAWCFTTVFILNHGLSWITFHILHPLPVVKYNSCVFKFHTAHHRPCIHVSVCTFMSHSDQPLFYTTKRW